MNRRKGVVYSFITLLLVTPSILLLMAYFNTFMVEGQNRANKIRAEEIRNFYESLILDLKRSLKISTQRAVLYAIQEVVKTGKPFNNSQEKISTMVLDGSLEGMKVPSLVGIGGYPCNTIACWNDSYSKIAKASNYELSIEKTSVDVKPHDSWNLNSSVSVEITIKDKYTGMTIKRALTESVLVPITGFEDPLYVICTKGKVARLINKQSYRTSVEGPSFLDRLEGGLKISDKFKSQSSNTIGLVSYIDDSADYSYFSKFC